MYIVFFNFDGSKTWFLNFWLNGGATVYPKSRDPFYMVTYYIKWVTACEVK